MKITKNLLHNQSYIISLEKQQLIFSGFSMTALKQFQKKKFLINTLYIWEENKKINTLFIISMLTIFFWILIVIVYLNPSIIILYILGAHTTYRLIIEFKINYDDYPVWIEDILFSIFWPVISLLNIFTNLLINIIRYLKDE